MKLTSHESWASKLDKEWDFSLNKDAPESYSHGSGLKAFWICRTCNYSFSATVKNRVNQRGCPACSHKVSVTGVNDLATLKPELVPFWSYDLNTKTPETVLANYSKDVWWNCCCGQSFRLAPREVSINRFESCKCLSLPGTNLIQGCNDLESLYPELVTRFDHLKNPNFNESIAVPSHKFWWLCNLGHSYERSLKDELRNALCPYCSGQKTLKGFNDLLTRFPNLAREWDYEKNTIRPDSISAGGRSKVWWKCKSGHSWKALVSNRAKNRSGCPTCSVPSGSKRELEVLEALRKLTNCEIIHNAWSVIPKYQLDFYIPDIKRAIEFNGNYWHSNERIVKTRGLSAVDYHKLKKDLCRERGIELAFIWEDDWTTSKRRIIDDLGRFLSEGHLSANLSRLYSRLD